MYNCTCNIKYDFHASMFFCHQRHDGFYYGKTKEDELGLVPSSYVTDVPRPQLSSLQHVPMTINPSHIQTPPLIKLVDIILPLLLLF